MKNKTTDIYEMLDTLSLPVAASVSQNCLKALNSAAIPLCSLSVRFWNLST